jgi:hypothetical protein
MKKWFPIVALLCIAQIVIADEKKDVIAAAKKLGDKANYSWRATTKVEGGASNWTPGPTEGQSEKGGYTFLSASLGDNHYEVAIKGDKQAIKRESEWESAEDLQGDNEWIARRLKSFKAPAAEAEDLANKSKGLKNEGGVHLGDLTEAGVKEIIARGRRTASDAKNAKGWVKFWIKDGVVTKYEYNLQGTITVGQDQREIDLNRTTTVEIKEVGTTKVSVPEGAKKKLS